MKQGEHITIKNNKLLSIEWYTDDKLDCSLGTENGKHMYPHGNGRRWQIYNIENNLLCDIIN